ncbi:glycoside hydrolase family 47 protein [Pseudocercospora fijiensis CIRAD86]|uniref:alpha-1,2-Mannosidase n=1 Tax=Pseudocercospora fijiensis (strain CIRAD86) TaxID=383855 RepID=M3AN37_PSEFD|nr:glycoside hydrolase family 47 protein [Pseudocercospora fijiensis CIRAD86]EME78867.1 glycoside hydrolase family 47 protein [Pseudocercospora fijiensis CIRAD86]
MAAAALVVKAEPTSEASALIHQWHSRQRVAGTTASCANADYPRQCGVGYDYRGFEKDQGKRAQFVIDQFRFAWKGYEKYAFPNDDLLPQNNSFRNSRNGWGLTAIDALDTAIIMQQHDIVTTILQFIPTIDFTKNHSPSPTTTSLFETNIRYLGGLLSAYDLLTGPFKSQNYNPAHITALLTQAQTLANALKFCFNTPTGIPVSIVNLDSQTFTNTSRMANGVYTAGLAELGTLVLEWQHLSDLTGDPSYGALAQRAESWWFRAREIWPGLTGGNFSVETGEVLDEYGGWISGHDSAYEYLIKMFVYDPDTYANYAERWKRAADSTLEHLLSHPASRPDLTMVQAFDGRDRANYSEGLACFIGGSFILGSTALRDARYLRPGLDFSEFCANGYRSTPSGIGPSIYSWDLERLSEPEFVNQSGFFERAGWFIPENFAFGGGQAPEAVESWYYAYQATGEQYWRDVAWAYVLSQERLLKVGSGFVSVRNVLREDGGERGNFMASFMLAEVLKYQYLIQAPPEKKGVWDVLQGEEKTNLFVYNTEAHPFRVRARRPV